MLLHLSATYLINPLIEIFDQMKTIMNETKLSQLSVDKILFAD